MLLEINLPSVYRERKTCIAYGARYHIPETSHRIASCFEIKSTHYYSINKEFLYTKDFLTVLPCGDQSFIVLENKRRPQ